MKDARLTENSCTIDGLKECNRRFIGAFGGAGEKIIMVEDNYDGIIANLMDG